MMSSDVEWCASPDKVALSKARMKAKVAAKAAAWKAVELAAEAAHEVEVEAKRWAEEGAPLLEINDDDNDGLMLELEAVRQEERSGWVDVQAQLDLWSAPLLDAERCASLAPSMRGSLGFGATPPALVSLAALRLRNDRPPTACHSPP